MKKIHLVWILALFAVAGCTTKYTILPPALHPIGEKHGVEAFFLGEIKISKVKPQVDLLAPLSKALFVRAKFDIAVTARLVSAANGAPPWAQSRVRGGTGG